MLLVAGNEFALLNQVLVNICAQNGIQKWLHDQEVSFSSREAAHHIIALYVVVFTVASHYCRNKRGIP